MEGYLLKACEGVGVWVRANLDISLESGEGSRLRIDQYISLMLSLIFAFPPSHPNAAEKNTVISLISKTHAVTG